MSDDVLAAFDALLDKMKHESERLKRQISQAALDGRFHEVRRLNLQAMRTTDALTQIRTVRQAWHQAYSDVELSTISTCGDPAERRESPILEGDAEVKTHFQGGQHELGADHTPQADYRVPILEALVHLGGRAGVEDVLALVYKAMETRLLPKDLDSQSSSDEARWRNLARWERKEMVEEGLLGHNSPRGIWEITEEGRAYLQRKRQEKPR